MSLVYCLEVLADELAVLRRRRAAKRQENRESRAGKPGESTQEAAKPVDAGGSATMGARPKVVNFSGAVAEAARQLSTDDLVVLLQQQGTASVPWNGMRKSKMLHNRCRSGGGRR